MKSNRFGRNPPPKRTVAIVVNLQSPAGRGMLAGVDQFLSEGHVWRLKVIQDASVLTSEAIRKFVRDGGDGLVVSELRERTDVRALAGSPLAISFVNVGEKPFAGRGGKTAFIWNDNADIGRRAAEHLRECGNFASYGFVNSFVGQRPWSEARGEAFRQALKASGHAVATYPLRDDCGSPGDAAALRDWVAALPKPAAILAASDWRAVQVFDACQAAGCRVPDQVSLLGVDNNDFDCFGIVPTLSSVQPDYEGIGYRAAAELEALMAGDRRATRPITLPARMVACRGSTKAIPPAAVLVQRGLDYIRAHACERTTPSDVARHLGVSRRLAELRFTQICNKTVRAVIERERLERVRRLLQRTDHSLSQIADQTGFLAVSHLSALFKKRFGVPPLAWRAKKRAEAVK